MSSGPNADTAGQDFCQNDGELKFLNYIPIYQYNYLYAIFESKSERLLLGCCCFDGRGDIFGGSDES